MPQNGKRYFAEQIIPGEPGARLWGDATRLNVWRLLELAAVRDLQRKGDSHGCATARM